ncbi:GNAT family N-acetyltransferase [Ruficoccus sp. ZRK36]|uniref:GNAT family N-acetyltransferase n=1 Tax=Ruficoccus sp. ZRK36 TaxID=2866311 RepID=UPI001C737DA9|nr:GNAT family N-acetyltransferase [Ruficoccus sp. ZRK36]QYY36072.1 GNAT family N-acetyltransferase [Ruficoccus sp. ZRK36]
MVEKGNTSALASDREDSCCQHVLATDDDGRHVATGRLECDGRLSRIVVLPEFRQHRLGDDVLSFLIDLARELGLETVYADVDERHIPFLLEMGFVEKAPPTLPPGAHRRPQRYMEMNLDT